MRISNKLCFVVGALAPLVVACGEGDPAAVPLASAGSSAAGQAGGSTAGSAGAPLAGGSAGSASAGSASGGGGASGGSGGTAGGSGGASGGSAGGGSGGASAGSGGSGGGAGGASGGSGGSGGAAAFLLTSPDLEHHADCTKDTKDPCDLIDQKNTMTSIGGQNQSPELNWSAGPAGTLSYAVVLHDTSNGQNGYTHWVVWNLPGATLQLPGNLQRKATLDAPQGARQASFQQDNAYAGPGAHGNVYELKVYALKVAQITVADAANEGNIRQQLEQSPDVLGTSVIRGKSQ